MHTKVALITGGASGIGFATAKALSDHPSETWAIHIVDQNAAAGKKAASELKNAFFHQADVTSYQSLTSAFEVTWSNAERLDFVFANAGIVERDNFYAKHDLNGPPPPPPNKFSADINYKAVVDTSYLALHYFRKTKAKNGGDGFDPVLIMTASCGGLYPSEFCPIYSGSKAGLILFNRAIAVAYHNESIRTSTICPGTIKTALMSEEEWKYFPVEYFTPVETVSDTVMKLVEGAEMKDAKGVKKSKNEIWGLTVEINGRNSYFRDGPEYCDDNMKEMMTNTSMTKQLARIEGKSK
ncbi:hypothetical protein COCC4DRAFT_35482 [Bipolaris maydis ATCC 48331]|uniref:15-hydroxyprostaglandin dehydrogenase n=2 Tax=Cochliobolus heterostrophus TaxID=5016 RepID=M2V6P2_COCH5|nr:uncharacterized protein COCC4DRAFT_35482 [Bipolaris maydis ATCC 48331]EMD95697.1 hypothetical protein COCHEDRAFT_1209984 [Bipolaris maydis C5]KAH7561620.1 hypothetical protein BM1_02724 [Bipolaris maydis]ENI10557.1 hypothetical protein COCC4DRAFT_35482 [Bipolaris maydis ATCC 48331]KAJ5030430.1 hypothetical protein J3E73DRAFT_404795 [Bipolaris maydis]KAJ5065441.1 hypothetical protein J3E74DRAFT_435216 [Bipolaris maydis]